MTPTPEEFMQLSLDELADIATERLIRIADLYVSAATMRKATLTSRELKVLKSCVRVILQELSRRSTTNDPTAELLRKYLEF